MKCDISVVVVHYTDYNNTGYMNGTKPELFYKDTVSGHASVEDCLRVMVTTMREFSPRNYYKDVKGWSDYRVFSHPALGWGYVYLFTACGKCLHFHINVKESVPSKRTKVGTGNS